MIAHLHTHLHFSFLSALEASALAPNATIRAKIAVVMIAVVNTLIAFISLLYQCSLVIFPANKNVFVVSRDMIQHSKAVFEPNILSDFSRESFSVHIII
jgi:hypothetical protein